MITASLLRTIDPEARHARDLGAIAASLWPCLVAADATTVTRAAALLSQCAWESGHWAQLVESEASARHYEGRSDLGNVEPGDGVRYRGRGYLHLTGRANYLAAGEALGIDLEAQPELAARPDVAASTTAWYWSERELNAHADALDYRAITRAINGAATDEAPSYHLRRERLYHLALEGLGCWARLG